MALMRQFAVDKLQVLVHDTRKESGIAAAEMAVKAILDAVSRKGEANVIFAAAPSQDDLLAALLTDKRIPWRKVNAFHLDEYHTLPNGAPQRFDVFLKKKIWDAVMPGSIFPVVPEDGMKAADIEKRYKKLMEGHMPDLALVGVGENGHLAFVDPPFADFEDKATIREVVLDEVCRNQQVNDGAFPKIRGRAQDCRHHDHTDDHESQNHSCHSARAQESGGRKEHAERADSDRLPRICS